MLASRSYGLFLHSIVDSNPLKISRTYMNYSRSGVGAHPVSAATSKVEGAVPTSELWSEICSRYDSAQAKNASSFTDTDTEVCEDQGYGFILKIARNLRDKPKAKKVPDGTWKNPFLPPDKDLFVCSLSETHSLVLNKFNITPHHVIIITNGFVPQEEPLSRADFTATWRVVDSMPGLGGMAFFNCGSISGASQPHKHIQCIPLPMASSGDGEPLVPPFESVIMPALAHAKDGEVIQAQSLPFQHGLFKIDRHIDDISIMSQVLEAGYNAIVSFLESKACGQWTRNDSYNFIMTREYMMIAPRRKEFIGSVGCNSMGFAGSFFLATQQEIDDVKKYGPCNVLAELGFSTFK
jgi:ATP adenylyltransferase